MEECPVCFIERPLGTLTCGHQVCPTCIKRCLQYDVRCVICRRIVHDCDPPIVLYSEYDTKKIKVEKKHLPLGIMMKTVDSSVIVIYSKHGLLKKGDRILAINSFPVTSHQQFTQILYGDGGGDFTITLEDLKKKRFVF